MSGLLLLVLTMGTWAQANPPAPTQGDALAVTVQQLQEQVKELRAAVGEIRAEAAQYRAETAELREQLQATRTQLAASSTLPTPATTSSQDREDAAVAREKALDARVASLEETSQLLSGKVDDQYQTKVDSASRYHVRLSGLVLLNLFSNRGSTDSQDFPNWAAPAQAFSPSGNFGATMRQSEIGLEVFGPKIAGARTSGNVQIDFSGGFPNAENGVNFGLVRLRIASMRMDWDHTSIVAGQDNLFLSPLSPTSFASLAVPTFGYSGNLWAWTPQVRVEHRFDIDPDQNVTLQAGIFDNLTGEPPYATYMRIPSSGESSSQPAYGLRTAWTRKFLFGAPMTLGFAAYYSRQTWGFSRHVDGWAGMSDWQIPIAPRLTLSGEFYRGYSVGGLGGGIGTSAVFSGNPLNPATQVSGISSAGGWSQLKLKLTSKLEFNGAFGIDNPFADELREFSHSAYPNSPLAQNRGTLVNFIYRPRSNLLFSSEYRHLRTNFISNISPTSEQVNLMMGILF